MLQKIRDKISGWIAGVIIALVAGAFMLFGVQYYFEQGSGDQNALATVNGVSITQAQISDLSSQLQNQMQQQGRPLTNALIQQIKAYALQSMVTETALSSTLKRDGFHVGTKQVQAMISQAPQFQVQGKFSEQKMMEVLYQMNVTPAQFFQRVQSQWMINQATNGIAASTLVLPNELNQAYALQNQKRAFGYFLIPAASFLSKVNITDAAIRAYYEAHQSEFQTPAKVSVAYIELSPDDLAKSVTVTEAEAKAYYQSHLSNYQLPQRWMVAQITLPVAANASQTDIQAVKTQAKQVASEFQKNKDTGFTSTTVTLNATQINPAVHTILSQLKEGGVSSPLRTANGYSVLKLVRAIPAETHSFDSVKNNVMQLLQHQAVNKILTKKSSELADVTYTNPDSLTLAAKTLNLPIQVSPMMTKSGEKTGIFADPKVLAAIFSDSVFQANNNSSPIALADGSQIVVRIQKKYLAQPIPLSTVSAKIKTQIAQKQASAQAGLLAYQIQKELLAGKTSTDIAKQNKLQWNAISSETPNASSTVPPMILSTAFSVPPKDPQAVLINQSDYAVIDVSAITDADATAISPTEKQKMSQQLSTVWSQLMQHCFVTSVIASSHVVVKKPT